MPRFFFNFQGSAVLAVLMFLSACLALVALGLGTSWAFATRRTPLARALAAFAGSGVLLYLGALLVFSLTSRTQVAELHERKYFCEIDCHLGYSVEAVRRASVLGTPPALVHPEGVFYVVTLRVLFDKDTISSRRPLDAPLTPNPRTVVAIVSGGRTFRESAAGESAWRAAGGKWTPLTESLVPGESYTTDLVFDLPADALDPRLLITESDVVTRLLIGHENSFLHRKTTFRLSA